MNITLPDEREISVDYKYKEAGFDSYSAHGWEQGDPPEVEIEKVYHNDKEVKLTDAEYEFVENYIHEHHIPGSDYEDQPDYDPRD